MLKSFIIWMLSKFDIKLSRASQCYGESLDKLAEESLMIGSKGAAEVFSRYIVIQDVCNDELKHFIQFYAEYYRHSRSQWSQDVFVMYMTGLHRGGSYLEIGGANGITHSNTIALRDFLGWSGVIVEPDPEMFNVLKMVRGGTDRIINAAISPKGGIGKASLRKVGQLSALTGYESHDLHYNVRMASENTTPVNTIDITELLQSFDRLDYFSLDVEGAEVEIIKSIGWDDVAPPAIITIEHNGRTNDIFMLRSILESRGYVEVFKDNEWLTRYDLWMVHKESGLQLKKNEI
jgi:FkbM family methyltransferase